MRACEGRCIRVGFVGPWCPDSGSRCSLSGAGVQVGESAGDRFVSGDLAVEDSSGCCFRFRGEGDAAHFEAGADACYFPFDLARGQDAGGFTRNLVSCRHGLAPRFSFCGCTRFCGFDAADPLSEVAGGVFAVLR